MAADPDNLGDFSKLIEKALKAIYDELVDVKSDIEPDLYKISVEAMNKAVDKAFAGISHDDPDYEFVQQLKTNNAVFAAFKTHRQQNDIARQLIDDDGKLKSFADFKKDTAAIVGDYNLNWLRTEYDTAVVRARMASRFKEFEKDADLYPNLKWTRSTSVHKREVHEKLYGLILPITHPFWTKHYPGNLWNCKCGIRSTDEPENSKLFKIDAYDETVPPGLEGNPAKTGAIFGKKHPYRAQAFPGAAKAVKNFVK